MAVSKFANWVGERSLGSNLILFQNYDVYADMANGSAQCYLRLNNFEIRSASDNQSQLSARVAATIKIQINGTGTTYTFSSGSSIQHYTGASGWYYYVKFSSATNVVIPGNGTPFTLNVTVTTKNSESYSFTEAVCGPVAVKISGPTSIYTGNVYTYTIASAVKNSPTLKVKAIMHTSFPTEGNTGYTYEGYASQYISASEETSNFTSIGFVPRQNNAAAGDVGRNASASYPTNYVDLEYYYISPNTVLRSQSYMPGRVVEWRTSYIMIGASEANFTITARAEVNSALKPEFDHVEYVNSMYSSQYALDYQIDRYGGGIQGQCNYDAWVCYKRFAGLYQNATLKYGASFKSVVVTDYLTGSAKVSSAKLKGSSLFYSHGKLDTAGTNMVVQYRMTDSYGFVTNYTDRVTVKPYHTPILTTHSVRRCKVVASGSGPDYYNYNGTLYKVDDYGEYALVEWGVDVTSLGDLNMRRLTVRAPNGSSMSDTVVALPSYICNGFYVTPANGEKSFDVVFTLKDDFATTTLTEPLSTSLAMMDFLRTGRGVALGKVAELTDTLDVNRTWNVKMPYNTYVNGYNNGARVHLRDWMTNVPVRMQGIINNRDVLIYGSTIAYNQTVGPKFFDGNTAAACPSGSCTITYPGTNGKIIVNNMAQNATSGILIGNAIKINRNYLYIFLDQLDSFGGQGWTPSGPVPTIWVMGTKPTSINQSTGKPNGTELTHRAITVNTYQTGTSSDGYCHYIAVPQQHWIDVSQWNNGQDAWIVITARNGQSQQGTYKFITANIYINKIFLTKYNS